MSGTSAAAPDLRVLPAFDAIVLAGGRAERLGGADKPMQAVGRVPLLARVLAAVAQAGRRVVVGRRRDDPGLPTDIVWTQEEPPASGPVNGIRAGLPLTTAPVVLVLAADLPWIAPAVEPLRAALNTRDTDAALLRLAGHDNYLAAAWRRDSLAGALCRASEGGRHAVRSLFDGVSTAVLDDDAGWSADCDTWDDLAAARRRSDGLRAEPGLPG